MSRRMGRIFRASSGRSGGGGRVMSWGLACLVTFCGPQCQRSPRAQPAATQSVDVDGLRFVLPPEVTYLRFNNNVTLKSSVMFEIPFSMLNFTTYERIKNRHNMEKFHIDVPFPVQLRPESEAHGTLSDSDWRLSKLTPRQDGDWMVYVEPYGYNLYVNRVGGQPHYYSCQRNPDGLCEVRQIWPTDRRGRSEADGNTTVIYGFTIEDRPNVEAINREVLRLMNSFLADGQQ